MITVIVDEIGEYGLKLLNSNLRFGVIVENLWASENNPHRYGIFVKHKKGKITLTNGNGDFWDLVHDKKSRTKIVWDKDYIPDWYRAFNHKNQLHKK